MKLVESDWFWESPFMYDKGTSNIIPNGHEQYFLFSPSNYSFYFKQLITPFNLIQTIIFLENLIKSVACIKKYYGRDTGQYYKTTILDRVSLS